MNRLRIVAMLFFAMALAIFLASKFLIER